ncbi:MAG: DUF4129 domain-containing protein [Anaerolineales bacterium]
MRESFFSLEARRNEGIFRAASRLLVALMLACGAQTFASLVGQVLPEWYPWYLSTFTFFTALACLVYTPRLKKLGLLSREWLLQLVTIWLVLLTSVRLLIGLGNGPAAFWAELMQWPQDSTLILSFEFFLALIAAFFTWLLADMYADLLSKLDLEYVRLQQEYSDPREASKPPVRQRLLHLTLSIGIFLVFLTALMRFDLRAALDSELVITQLPRLAGGGASTLLFFGLALALFSLTQFMNLQGRWSLNKVPTSSNLAGRWAQYSLFFLAVLTLIVALLPTHYSLGFLSLLGVILRFALAALYFVIQLFLSLFISLVNALFSSAGQEPILEESPMPEMNVPEFFDAEGQEPLPITDAPPWVEILRQVFFWLVLLFLVSASLRYVLQNNSDLVRELRRFRILALLSDLFGRLFGFFKQAGVTLADTIQGGFERLRSRRNLRQSVGDWINLRLLDPRRKVYFYYQAFLRRSNESGLPRSLSQTPAEFAQRLDQILPESEPDIESLTAAFIEARYTRREIPDESAGLARRTWQRLRKALGMRRKQL